VRYPKHCPEIAAQEPTALGAVVRSRGSEVTLGPVKGHKKLTACSGSVVRIPVLDRTRPAGARLHGRTWHEMIVLARREVTLATGAFGSPQILMVTGIGLPKDLLDRGIDFAVA